MYVKPHVCFGYLTLDEQRLIIIIKKTPPLFRAQSPPMTARSNRPPTGKTTQFPTNYDHFLLEQTQVHDMTQPDTLKNIFCPKKTKKKVSYTVPPFESARRESHFYPAARVTQCRGRKSTFFFKNFRFISSLPIGKVCPRALHTMAPQAQSRDQKAAISSSKHFSGKWISTF